LHCPSCAETLGEQRKEKAGNHSNRQWDTHELRLFRNLVSESSST
jgi:hypothetical protein